MKSKKKVLGCEIHYLSPENCDSTIGYSITKGKYLHATVKLSDCSRSIEWYFDRYEPISKVDVAIQTLQNFRATLIKARSRCKKR